MRARGGWLALSLLGCGSGTDVGGQAGATGLAGMYMTTSHTLARPCEAAPQPAPLDDPAFFRIDEEHLDNGWFVSAHRCTGASASTCDEQEPPLFQAGRNVGNGRVFTERLSRSQGEGDHCLATWTGHLVVPSEGGATLRQEVRAGDWTGRPCSDPLFSPYLQNARTLECRVAEVWVGKKL